MSAASFLGIAGLIFLFGFDGFLYSVGFLVAFLTVLFLLAERMRNSGKYTIADVLAYRMKQPAGPSGRRARHALGGRLLPDRADGRRGRDRRGPRGHRLLAAVVLTGAFMIIYIVAGGMLATSWVQIIKAFLLMSRGVVLTVWVLSRIGWNPLDLFRDARAEVGGRRGLPAAGPVPVDAARHGLARSRPRARHGGAAAHPDALLHGADAKAARGS